MFREKISSNIGVMGYVAVGVQRKVVLDCTAKGGKFLKND